MGYNFLGTPGLWLCAAMFIAGIGAATLKGCEYGCSYVSSKSELKWKGDKQ